MKNQQNNEECKCSCHTEDVCEHADPVCCENWCDFHANMTYPNDWEKKFDMDIYIPHSPTCIGNDFGGSDDLCDCNHDENIREIKEFIRQQRQEAVEEYKETSKNHLHVTLEPKKGFGKKVINDAQKKAVREFAEKIEKNIPNIPLTNKFNHGFRFAQKLYLDAINKALEVYEKK